MITDIENWLTYEKTKISCSRYTYEVTCKWDRFSSRDADAVSPCSKQTLLSSSSLELDSRDRDASTTEKEKYGERGRIDQHSLKWKQCYCVISYL
jgi:hypothetical protein